MIESANDSHTMFLFPCGIMAKMKYAKIEGMITAQCLRFGRIQYEISYFNSGEQKYIWVDESQFETSAEKCAIGFK